MCILIYSLKSDFDLPATPARHKEYAPNDLKIVVKTVCLGRAKKTVTDIGIALDHGAIPAAQSVIRSHVSTANTEKLPLACKLEYTP